MAENELKKEPFIRFSDVKKIYKMGETEIQALAGELSKDADGPMYILLEQDMAKALGQALAARLPKETPILCLDGLRVGQDSYLDVGLPVGPAIPVVIKTLVFER